MNLPYYLECVGKAAGKDSGIEYREAAGQNILYVRSLEDEHEKHSHCTRYKELKAGQFNTLGAGGKIADCQDMKSKCKGTENDIEVSSLQHKLPAHAQKVEAAYSQEHGAPQCLAYTLADDKAKTWNQHYVQRCDKSGLARCSILDSHLLQVGGKTKEKAADKAACKEDLALLAWFWNNRFIPAENRDEGNKEKTAYECPDGVESKRFHIGHTYPLRDKGRAPYKGCKQKQKAAGQFLISHIRQIIKKILVCKYFFCYIVDE